MHLMTQTEVARKAWNSTRASHLPDFDECGEWFQQQLTTRVQDIVMCGNAPVEGDVFGQAVVEMTKGQATGGEVMEDEDPRAEPGVVMERGGAAGEEPETAETAGLKSGFEKPSGKRAKVK